MDFSSLALNIASLAISLAAILISRRAQRVTDRANEPNIRFQLTCHGFTTKLADLELITSNLSSKANAVVKTRVALMDGPPAAMTLRFTGADGRETEVFAKAGVRFPPKRLLPKRHVVRAGTSRSRQANSISRTQAGAVQVRATVEHPRLVVDREALGFDLPEKLPDHALDSLRVWAQARDTEGRLWEQMLILAEGVVESCHI